MLWVEEEDREGRDGLIPDEELPARIAGFFSVRSGRQASEAAW